jgi:GH24 family phage-related lysozyme (muramidase)
MSDFARAINLIKKYEGYSEKAYPDQVTGVAPYTFGYGTQYYPDGSPVKQGHCCTERKALEYLAHEVEIIDHELTRLNLGLDDSMRNALISFIHSIGWEPFLYSEIIDQIEIECWGAAAEEITRWIFDSYYKVIGGLVDRRREEAKLFLNEVRTSGGQDSGLLLGTFRNYTGAPHQLNAIQILENSCNPYILAEFFNAFNHREMKDLELEYGEIDPMFASWD